MSQSSKPIEALIANCNKAAKEKEYDVALNAANAALRASENDKRISRVTLFDLRIAVYLRTENLDLALRDAKTMIRLDRQDERGYLRCGQIERLKGNKFAAQKYYEHGLKNVPASNGNFASLVNELEDINAQIRGDLLLSRASDPMTALPLEIVELILSHIGYKQHVQMLRVSKNWNRILLSLRPLIDTLSFAGASKQVTPKMLRATLRRLKVPKTVKVSNVTDFSADALMKSLGHWQSFRSLQHLELLSGWLLPWTLPMSKYSLKSIVIGESIPVPFEWVCTSLQECTGLESAEFHCVYGTSANKRLQNNHLQQLKLFLEHVTPSREMFVGTPRLRELDISGLFSGDLPSEALALDLRSMSQLQILYISDSALPVIYLPPSIKELGLIGVLSNHLGEEYGKNGPVLENLRSLFLSDCEGVPKFIMDSATKTQPGKLIDCTLVVDYGAAPAFMELVQSGWLKGLKRLELTNYSIKDIHSKLFIESCPNLETLSLSEAPITSLFVSDLIKVQSSKLRTVTLRCCINVSRDIVPWGLTRGVDVELINNYLDSGGRRVRELQ